MRVVIVDISGKVFKYDDALFNSIINEDNGCDEIICLTPYKNYGNSFGDKYKLCNLIPLKNSSSSNIIKRVIKSIECIINYILIARIIINIKPDIIHFQWLPFLEFCSFELIILKWYKKLYNDINIILTVHNIYPHNLSRKNKFKYFNRFVLVDTLINKYIVHTKCSQIELNEEFNIPIEKIAVVNHGVFVPSVFPARNRKNSDKCRLLMYGFQSYYKGTDLLLEAIKHLPNNYLEMIEVKIIGKMSNDILSKIECDEYKSVIWKNSFVSDEELYQEIFNADVLVYPYRQISQSGALLLGLSFGKPIIASDLVAFHETLENYPSQMFFKVNDYFSLKDTIINYLSADNEFVDFLVEKIEYIKNTNSWEMSAINTLNLYKSMY